MRRISHALCVLVVLSSGGAASAQEAGRCVIDDPTGTPLNVRTAPNGTIVSTLANGTRVDPLDETVLGGKRWLFVARQGVRLGWVFGAYVVCRNEGDASEAAPIPPAGQR